jgi:3-dehydroquinate synthase
MADAKRWTLQTQLPVAFTVHAADGLFEQGHPAFLHPGPVQGRLRRLIVIDEEVFTLHGERIEQYFLRQGVDYRILPVVATETQKDLDTLMTILSAMESFHLLRQSEPVIGIGGGVLLDVVGFAAAIYRRGVPYLKVPTTLLSLVDVSIGVKTAVNHFGNRNRLGAYHPPQAVFLDRSFLRTLEPRAFSNGLAEILKMALLKDARLFDLLETHGLALISEKFPAGEVALEVIDRAIQTMAEELEPNLWEKHLQRSVDFGHSFSPILEMRALPQLTHGEAVALDMLLSCLVSQGRGLLPDRDLERIFETTRRLGLPTYHEMFGDPVALWESLADTVIHRNGDQNLPMIPRIGSFTFFPDVTVEEVARAAQRLRARSAHAEG